MIVYYNFMRLKDESKNDAIFTATIDLLNEIGFADTSMSKIAKRANISSSTIYVYFENKDDMLKKAYLFVKQKLFEYLGDVIAGEMPVKETVVIIMRKLLDYMLENRSYFLFLEQFESSPFMEKLCLHDQSGGFMQMYHAYVNDAKAKGILKDVDTSLLIMYCYFPMVYLAKDSFHDGKEITEEIIEQAIDLSWQAIRA